MDFTRPIFERLIEKTIQSWLNRPEGILIYGARQVGKSTFLKHLLTSYPQARYLSFDENETMRLFSDNPQGVLEQVALSYDPIFIDEFQKVPQITIAVKYLVDNKVPAPKFFLSGSISDALAKEGDSMIGRVVRFPLYTLSFGEYLAAKKIKTEAGISLEKIMPSQWQLELLDRRAVIEAELGSYLQNGGYPATIKMSDKQLISFFQTLKTTFLEKDLLTRLRLGQIQNLTNLATILAKRVGFPLSLNNLANELGIDIKTVKKLLDILKYTYWIEVVHPQARYGSEFKNKFKVYFLDNGLRNFLAQVSQSWDFERGPIFENCVYGVLRRFLSYNQEPGKINFWHTYGGGEIDFIIEKGLSPLAIEVKAGKLSRPIISPSLRSFIKQYSPKEAIIINKDFSGEVRIGRTVVYFLPLYIFALLI